MQCGGDTTARLVPSRITALRGSAILILTMMLLVAPATRASTFVVPDLNLLVSMSSAVVRGTVISATCHRADNNRIVTDYTVMVEEVAAGKLDDGRNLSTSLRHMPSTILANSGTAASGDSGGGLIQAMVGKAWSRGIPPDSGHGKLIQSGHE